MVPIRIDGVTPSASERRVCSAAWASTARIAWIQTLTLIGVLSSSLVLAMAFAPPNAVYWLATTTVVLLLAMIVSGSIVMSAYARACVDAAQVPGPARWTIDGRGLQVETGTGVVSHMWEGVAKVVDERDRFVFAISPSDNPVLPKRQMTHDQIAAVKTLIADVTASGRLGRGVD